MSVQYSYPKYKLAAQLKEAGGLAVADAVVAAQSNLAELAPPCLSELQAATAAAMAAFRAFPPRYSHEALDELYAIASRAVGLGAICGAPGADKAFASLCSLVDHFGGAERWDLEAIAVHVHTLQLLVSDDGSQVDDAAANRLLSGLVKVSARYAQPPPAASAA
jgi:hypothetical protein